MYKNQSYLTFTDGNESIENDSPIFAVIIIL